MAMDPVQNLQRKEQQAARREQAQRRDRAAATAGRGRRRI